MVKQNRCPAKRPWPLLKSSEISTAAKATDFVDSQLEIGSSVQVMPIDYGFQPTQGQLLLASSEEIVVQRTDQRAGSVAVHFPRLGFQVEEIPKQNARTGSVQVPGELFRPVAAESKKTLAPGPNGKSKITQPMVIAKPAIISASE